jgi:hypothetical protein
VFLFQIFILYLLNSVDNEDNRDDDSHFYNSLRRCTVFFLHCFFLKKPMLSHSLFLLSIAGRRQPKRNFADDDDDIQDFEVDGEWNGAI